MAVFESSSSSSDRNFDYLCKIILIGDANVGKTGLTLRFCEDNYNTSYNSTIGIDFKLRTVVLDGKKIKLQIWDTAGQERFQTLTRVYYRGTAGAIFVYDITRNKTFENIENWLTSFENATGTKIPKVLIGNKVDKSIEREVGYARAQAVADKFDMRFCEASAKTGFNVENAFFALARDIIAQKEEENSKRDALDSFGLTGNKPRKTHRRKKWFSKCIIL